MFEKYDKISDQELFTMLKIKDRRREKAFAEIYARHSNRIYAYLLRIVGDRLLAEDLFQETFTRFVKSADENREMTNLPAYVLRIARNLALQHKRDNKFSTISIDNIDLGFQDNSYEEKEINSILKTALELLPDDYREALALQIYNEMTYNEIAEFLDVPMTTVRNRIVRAKQKLREIALPYLSESF